MCDGVVSRSDRKGHWQGRGTTSNSRWSDNWRDGAWLNSEANWLEACDERAGKQWSDHWQNSAWVGSKVSWAERCKADSGTPKVDTSWSAGLDIQNEPSAARAQTQSRWSSSAFSSLPQREIAAKKGSSSDGSSTGCSQQQKPAQAKWQPSLQKAGVEFRVAGDKTRPQVSMQNRSELENILSELPSIGSDKLVHVAEKVLSAFPSAARLATTKGATNLLNYRAHVCKRWQMGWCGKGERCTLAHGAAEQLSCSKADRLRMAAQTMTRLQARMAARTLRESRGEQDAEASISHVARCPTLDLAQDCQTDEHLARKLQEEEEEHAAPELESTMWSTVATSRGIAQPLERDRQTAQNRHSGYHGKFVNLLDTSDADDDEEENEDGDEEKQQRKQRETKKEHGWNKEGDHATEQKHKHDQLNSRTLACSDAGQTNNVKKQLENHATAPSDVGGQHKSLRKAKKAKWSRHVAVDGTNNLPGLPLQDAKQCNNGIDALTEPAGPLEELEGKGGRGKATNSQSIAKGPCSGLGPGCGNRDAGQSCNSFVSCIQEIYLQALEGQRMDIAWGTSDEHLRIDLGCLIKSIDHSDDGFAQSMEAMMVAWSAGKLPPKSMKTPLLSAAFEEWRCQRVPSSASAAGMGTQKQANKGVMEHPPLYWPFLLCKLRVAWDMRDIQATARVLSIMAWGSHELATGDNPVAPPVYSFQQAEETGGSIGLLLEIESELCCLPASASNSECLSHIGLLLSDLLMFGEPGDDAEDDLDCDSTDSSQDRELAPVREKGFVCSAVYASSDASLLALSQRCLDRCLSGEAFEAETCGGSAGFTDLAHLVTQTPACRASPALCKIFEARWPDLLRALDHGIDTSPADDLQYWFDLLHGLAGLTMHNSMILLGSCLFLHLSKHALLRANANASNLALREAGVPITSCKCEECQGPYKAFPEMLIGLADSLQWLPTDLSPQMAHAVRRLASWDVAASDAEDLQHLLDSLLPLLGLLRVQVIFKDVSFLPSNRQSGFHLPPAAIESLLGLLERIVTHTVDAASVKKAIEILALALFLLSTPPAGGQNSLDACRIASLIEQLLSKGYKCDETLASLCHMAALDGMAYSYEFRKQVTEQFISSCGTVTRPGLSVLLVLSSSWPPPGLLHSGIDPSSISLVVGTEPSTPCPWEAAGLEVLGQWLSLGVQEQEAPATAADIMDPFMAALIGFDPQGHDREFDSMVKNTLLNAKGKHDEFSDHRYNMLCIHARSPRPEVLKEGFDLIFTCFEAGKFSSMSVRKRRDSLESIARQKLRQPGATAAAAILMEEFDRGRAEELHKRAMEKGSALAPFNLGGFYKTRDPKTAFKYYKAAAERGNALAMHKCGHMLEVYQGVKLDIEASKHFYRDGCEHGNGMCYNNLASMIDNDDNGISEEALTLYHKGAQLGCAFAKTGLARAKLLGPHSNAKEALSLLQEAVADESHSSGKAAFVMGMLYSTPEFCDRVRPEWSASLMRRAELLEPGVTDGMIDHFCKIQPVPAWNQLPPVVEGRKRNAVAQTAILREGLAKYGRVPLAAFKSLAPSGPDAEERMDLEEVLQIKQEGNDLFVQGKFAEARQKYHDALALLKAKGIKRPLDLSAGRDREEVSYIFANSAECNIRLQNWRSAEEYSRHALTFHPANEKAKFRLRKALLALGHSESEASELASLALNTQADPCFGMDTNPTCQGASFNDAGHNAPESQETRSIQTELQSPALKKQLQRQKHEGIDYLLVGRGDLDAGVRFSHPMGQMMFKVALDKALKGCRKSVYVIYTSLQANAKHSGISDEQLRKQLRKEWGFDPVDAKDEVPMPATEVDISSILHSAAEKEEEEAAAWNRNVAINSRVTPSQATMGTDVDARSAVHHLIKQQPLASHRMIWGKLKADFPQFSDTTLEQVRRYSRKLRQKSQQADSMEQVAEMQKKHGDGMGGMLNSKLAEWMYSEDFDNKYKAACKPDPARMQAYNLAKESARDSGSAVDHYKLARHYMTGDGTRKDFTRAYEALKRAKELSKATPDQFPDIDHTIKMVALGKVHCNFAETQANSDEAWLAFSDAVDAATSEGNKPDTVHAWEKMLNIYGYSLDNPLPINKREQLCSEFTDFFQVAGVHGTHLSGLTHNRRRLPAELRPETKKCGHCRLRAKSMKKCSVCSQTWCSDACQRSGWQEHEATCRAVFFAQSDLPDLPEVKQMENLLSHLF